MNEPYKSYFERYVTLCEQVVSLAEEYHETRAITAATQLADKFYELIQMEGYNGHKLYEDM